MKPLHFALYQVSVLTVKALLESNWSLPPPVCPLRGQVCVAIPDAFTDAEKADVERAMKLVTRPSRVLLHSEAAAQAVLCARGGAPSARRKRTLCAMVGLGPPGSDEFSCMYRAPGGEPTVEMFLL